MVAFAVWRWIMVSIKFQEIKQFSERKRGKAPHEFECWSNMFVFCNLRMVFGWSLKHKDLGSFDVASRAVVEWR